jgi:hypothetical protein
MLGCDAIHQNGVFMPSGKPYAVDLDRGETAEIAQQSDFYAFQFRNPANFANMYRTSHFQPSRVTLAVDTPASFCDEPDKYFAALLDAA